jgi:hypothetical protein
MNATIKAALVLAALTAAGASPTMAAPYRHHPVQDPWVQSIHEDNSAAPAKQFFEQMQRDGQ